MDCSGAVAAGGPVGRCLRTRARRGFRGLCRGGGALTVNPMAREGYALIRGDVLDFAVRFVVHDGDVEEADVAGMWGAFDAGGTDE